MNSFSQPLGKLGLITAIIGVIALLAWGEYERGWMLTVALLCGGVGLVAGSLEILLAQRGERLQGVGRWYEHWGFALYPWAFVFLMVGLSLSAYGLLRLLGWEPAFGAYLGRRPGVALIVFGLTACGGGLATLIGQNAWRDSPWDWLLFLPARLVGLLLTAAGLAAVLLGAIEVVTPAGFDRWLEGLLGPFLPSG